MSTRVKIIALAVLTAFVIAGVIIGVRLAVQRDTVEGCAKVVKAEAVKNMMDTTRKVQSDLHYLPECDGLTKAQQDEATEMVFTDVMDKVFSGGSPNT